MCYLAPGVEQVVAPSAHSYLSPRDYSATPVAERWVEVSNGRNLTQARHGSQDDKALVWFVKLNAAPSVHGPHGHFHSVRTYREHRRGKELLAEQSRHYGRIDSVSAREVAEDRCSKVPADGRGVTNGGAGIDKHLQRAAPQGVPREDLVTRGIDHARARTRHHRPEGLEPRPGTHRRTVCRKKKRLIEKNIVRDSTRAM